MNMTPVEIEEPVKTDALNRFREHDRVCARALKTTNRTEGLRMKQTGSTGRPTGLAAWVLALLICTPALQVRETHAAGAVEMQVERIVVLAIEEYNDAMAAGDPAAWLKYFTEGVRRRAPQSEQAGKEAFDRYYRMEFETFRAKWTTRKMIIAGRSAAVEFEWDAVHKASDAPVKVNMVAVFQLAPNGKFESVNFYYDSAKLAPHNVADATPPK
jgi:hypothetical protein